MATIKICDICKNPMDRCMPRNYTHYSLRKWGRKMEVCGECMENFLEWAGLPSQGMVIMPPGKPPKCKSAESSM